MSFIPALGYSATSPTTPLGPATLSRRTPQPLDVVVAITFCGVCHSDYHHIKNDWKDTKYPVIPGHEIVGRVVDLGSHVTKFQIGDDVAIGNMVDSCQHCASCQRGDEQYCLNGGPSWVYNSNERIVGSTRTLRPDGDKTYGGYTNLIVCTEQFVLRLPVGLSQSALSQAAPLLCAGITVYYPLKRWRAGTGHKVGIAGIGGLGHMAVKLAKAMGAEVIALTRTQWKLDDSLRLGADDSVLMTNSSDRARYKEKLDFILSTVPVTHDVSPYLELLKSGQTNLHIVGNMNSFPNLEGKKFVNYGKNISSSNVGGLSDTQEMIDFCFRNHTLPEVQLISIQQVNQAMQLMITSQVKYRFVIDMSSLSP